MQLDAACMTGDAFHRLPGVIHAVEGEAETAGGGVLECEPLPTGRGPVVGGMAVGAIGDEHSLVRSRFSVAVKALNRFIFGRGAGQGQALRRFAMAICTRRRGVCSVQREAGLGMVEAGHAVMSIVALQAALSEVLDVLLEEGWVVRGVALGTLFKRCGEALIRLMAGRAVHPCLVIVQLVPSQAEAYQRMVKFFHRWLDRVERFPAVIRVAVGATVDTGDLAVRPALAVNLLPDVRVAFLAQDILRGFERCMAELALHLELGVRGEPTQGHPSQVYRAELAGAEEQVAVTPHNKP